MVTYREILDLAEQNGIRKEVVTAFDEQYYLPTENWVTKYLGASYLQFLDSVGIEFRDEQWDCDNYAKMATVVADLAFYKTKKKEGSLAFGIFCYWSESNNIWGAHAINVAIIRNLTSNKIEFVFFEPQPSPVQDIILKHKCLTKIQLPRDEVSSCFALLFI